MTLKHTDLLRCVPSMRILCEKDNVPFKTALAISKNVSLIDSAIDSYLKEKDGLSTQYLTSDGKAPTVIPGFEEEYLKALTDLNDKTVDLPISLISPEALSGITLAPKHIQCIAFMLDT